MDTNLLSDKPPVRARLSSPAAPATDERRLMLVPAKAWRILNARTGGMISRPTFYRWLSSGKVYAVRVGHRLYIPWPVMEELIGQCLAGERVDLQIDR